MNTIKIAVPAFKNRSKIHFDKGKHWSIIEHLILEAISLKNYTATQLEHDSKIPRSIILESLARLMRAGWAEVMETGHHIEFKATIVGQIAADNPELPSAVNRLSKNANFIIDLISGSTFKSHEIPFYVENRLSNLGNIHVLKVTPQEKVDVDLETLANSFLSEDEKFIAFEPALGRPYKGYAVFTILNGQIENEPKNMPSDLKQLLLLEAESIKSYRSKTSRSEKIIPPLLCRATTALTKFSVRLNFDDLLLDAMQHEDYLLKVFRFAKTKIFIHSTFIREPSFSNLLPEMKLACSRGVEIFIYWGHEESQDNSTFSAINSIREKLKSEEINYAINISSRSTLSHAKILVSDSGENGQFESAIGSCNWLSTPFKSFEGSVVIKDQLSNKYVLRLLLSLASSTHSMLFKNPILRVLEELKNGIPSKEPNCIITFVNGSNHAKYVLKARDEAKRKIIVTSNKLSSAATPSVISPLMAAAGRNKDLEIEVMYGKTSAGLSRADGKKLSSDLLPEGIQLRAVKKPGLHAKIIAWDNDNAIISSMNWLSTVEIEKDSLHEIGVHVECEEISTYIYKRLTKL